MSEEEKTKDPGVTCPKCKHHFPIGLADAMRNAMAGYDPESDYAQGYHEAVHYWFLKLFFGGLGLGVILGIVGAKALL